MKIVYLHQYFNTPAMGGSTRSFEFARRLVADGHEVHIVTTHRDGDSDAVGGWLKSVEEGIHVHWYALPYSNKRSYTKCLPVFARFALASSIKALSLRGDLVFATSTPLTIAIPGLLASGFGFYKPFVFEVRDLWPEMPIAIGAIKKPIFKFLARTLERISYRCSDSIIALSPGVKQGVVRGGADSRRVAVIPNISNFEFFNTVDPELGRALLPKGWECSPIVLYTGSLDLENGVGYLSDLALELERINSVIKILIVGDGVEKPAVIAKAEASGLRGHRIEFLDSVNKYQVAALYKVCTIASNIVVNLPEARAISANKFLDSLAASCPVLVNHGGWMHDLIQNTGCGISTWGLPLAEAALLVDQKLCDRQWLDFSGSAAGGLARQYFDRDLQYRQLANILRRALVRRGRGVDVIAPGHFGLAEDKTLEEQSIVGKTLWIVNQYASSPDTGMGGRHYYLGKALAERGMRVRVLSSSNHHLLRRPEQFDGVYRDRTEGKFEIRWLKTLRNAEARSVFRVINWFVFIWRLYRVTTEKDQTPDVILCSSPSPFSFVGSKLLAKRFGSALIFEVRDIWPLTLIELGGYTKNNLLIRLMQRIEDDAYRTSDRVISNLPNISSHVKQRLKRDVNCEWIPNGFSTTEFEYSEPLSSAVSQHFPDGGFTLGYLGTFGEANALDILLRAALLLRHEKRINIVLVGKGRAEQELQAFAREKGLKNVHFLGQITKAQVPAMLSRFDCCYIGWRDEAIYRFGVGANKIAEYMISGKPIIHSYSGATDPIVISDSGFTVPAESPQALAQIIRKVAQMEPRELAKLGENGRRYAQENYDYQRVAQRLGDMLLKEVAGA